MLKMSEVCDYFLLLILSYIMFYSLKRIPVGLCAFLTRQCHDDVDICSTSSVHAKPIYDVYDVQHGLRMNNWFDALFLYGKWIMKAHGKPKSLSAYLMQFARMKPMQYGSHMQKCIPHAVLRTLITLKPHATMIHLPAIKHWSLKAASMSHVTLKLYNDANSTNIIMMEHSY